MPSFPEFFADVEARVGVEPLPEPSTGEALAPFVEAASRLVDAYVGTGVDGPTVSVGERVSLVDGFVPDAADQGWGEIGDQVAQFYWESVVEDLGADAIAAYLPWHVFHERWGIVINGLALEAFSLAIANKAGAPVARVAPLVLRQVLEHEYTHFSFEVAGTAIEDVLGEPRYVGYVARRYGLPNRWSTGPLEELVATWAESLYASRPASHLPGGKPRGYRRAVQDVNRLSPPGYRDFERMSDERDGERIVADVASLIAGKELWTPHWWPGTTAEERDQVPLYWQPGMGAGFEVFGLEKPAPPGPRTKDFEHWARRVAGATLSHGTKHPRVTFASGRSVPYSGRDQHLRRHEMRTIAAAAGLQTASELARCIQEGIAPEALAAAR